MIARATTFAILLVSAVVLSVNAFVVPTGQFCPHRSNAWYTYMDHLESVSRAHEQLISLDEADHQKATHNSNEKMTTTVEDFLYEYERLVHFRENSPDYQLREYCSEPHLFHQQINEIEDRLVPLCRAFTEQQHIAHSKGTKDNDDDDMLVQKLLRRATTTGFEELPQDISAGPFLPKVFQSQSREVQLETLELLDHHKDAIAQGANFGVMQGRDQKRYLQSLQDIEERWEIAFSRFQLMDGLNPDYLMQCHQWLEELGLDERSYRKLHAARLLDPNGSSIIDDVPTIGATSASATKNPERSLQLFDQYSYDSVFQ